MKKALIALSIAAGMVSAAQAENTTTLYGSIGYDIDVSSNGSFENVTDVNANDLGNDFNDDRWNLKKDEANFGIKGTEDLANGMQAIYNIKFAYNTNGSGINETTLAYIGLKSNWGTVVFGRQDSLYKLVTNYNDFFQDMWYGDLVHYGTLTGGGELSKTISYLSPDFSGFQFAVAGILDGSHDFITESNEDGFTGAQAGLWYDMNGWYAGVAYSWIDAELEYDNGWTQRPGTQEVFGGAVGYSNDRFRVGLAAEHASSQGEKYNLAGQYYYGPNTFRAAFGVSQKSDDISSSDNIYTYALGYQYNFSKRTYTWVEGGYIDWSDARLGSNDRKADDGYTVRVGLRHDF